MEALECRVALFIISALSDEHGDNQSSNDNKDEKMFRQVSSAQQAEAGSHFKDGGMWIGKNFLEYLSTARFDLVDPSKAQRLPGMRHSSRGY